MMVRTRAGSLPLYKLPLRCRMETPGTFWFGFNLAVVVLLVLDLVVLDRARRGPSMVESVVTTLVTREGWGKGSEFFTGYVIEYSLSVDNLFLFVLIFSNFRVTAEQQRRL